MKMKEIREFDFNGMGFSVYDKDGEPWFVAKEVCDILGVSNSRDAISRRIPAEERASVVLTDVSSSTRNTITANVVNESGLYRLIFTSRKKEAEAFKNWVFSVVLPTIRKTGGYISSDVEMSHENITKIIEESKIANERVERLLRKTNNLRKRNQQLRDKNDVLEFKNEDLECELRRSKTKVSEYTFNNFKFQMEQALENIMLILEEKTLDDI